MRSESVFDRYPTQCGIIFGVLAVLPVGIFASIIVRFHKMPLLELLEAIASLSVILGVFIAVAVYITNVKWRKKDKQDDHSEFYLKRAIEGLEIFYDLLKDRNNDRVTWVQAARVLLDNNIVSDKISNQAHRIVFELKKDYIRHQLYMVLHPRNEATGMLEPLPPQFFYGIDNWKEDISIDNAARASTDPVIARRVEVYKLRHTPKLSSLSEKSIIAIYEFLKYPENYEDRLDNIDSWDLTRENFEYLFESPWKYLKHKKEHVVSNGMCYPEGDEEAREQEWIRVQGEPPP